MLIGNVAPIFPKYGYAGFLHGKVVDMLYFPIIHTRLPLWIPFWGGKFFDFFSPIFNMADASISIGIISIFVFQKKFFGHHRAHSLIDSEKMVKEGVEVSESA